MEKVKEFLNSIASIDQEDWLIFSSKLEYVEYDKKAVILKLGKTENYIYYVEDGILRYFIPKINNDLTFGFSFENELASAYDSFLKQLPADYQIETLTPTKIWRISFSNLNEIYNTTKVGSTIGRILSEQLFIKSIKRELSLLNESAEQRYLNLFTERPNLVQKIPLKFIASYIGITPQALSRIRNQIS